MKNTYDPVDELMVEFSLIKGNKKPIENMLAECRLQLLELLKLCDTRIEVYENLRKEVLKRLEKCDKITNMVNEF